MAQKENTYRVGFGRIRLGFDQAVTASEGLTPEEVRNIIDAEVDKIYINENENQSNQTTLRTITKNNHTYVLPNVKTYDSENPIRKTTGAQTDTFSLEYDETLQVVNGRLSVVDNGLTAEPTSAVSITNKKLDVKTGNTITKSNDGKLNVKVKSGDKLLTQSADGIYSVLTITGPTDTIVSGVDTRQYVFKGVGNTEIGTVSFPLPSERDNNHKISSVTFNTSTKKLVIVETNPNGTDTTENRAEVVIGYPTYTAGTAIDINNDAISVKYDNSTIKVNNNGQLYCDIPVNSSEPIAIGSNNTLSLNYNTEQFELIGSSSPRALSIKSTVVTSVTDPISATVAGHTIDIGMINTALETKTSKTYVDGELNKKLDKTTGVANSGKYLTVDNSGNIVFTDFPLDDGEIDAFKNLGDVLTYKGIVQSVSSLPSAENSETGDFYFVNTGTVNEPHYAEYVFSDDTNAWEKLGDREPIVYTAGTNISINGAEISCTIDTNDFVQASSMNDYYTKTQTDNKFLTINDAASTYLTSAPEYTAGTNITIDANNVISATDTTYTAGEGITIDANNVISARNGTKFYRIDAVPSGEQQSGYLMPCTITTPQATLKSLYDDVKADKDVIVNVVLDGILMGVGNIMQLGDLGINIFCTPVIGNSLPSSTSLDIVVGGFTINSDGSINSDASSVPGIVIQSINLDISQIPDSTHLRTTWSNKQDALTAGSNITIDSSNVISATVPDMTNYYTKSQVYNKTDIDTKFANLQDNDTTYTAGTNVQISNQNVISATDTKYTGDGTTVTINNNNVISANIPDTSNFVTSQSINLFRKIRVYGASGISNSLSNIDTTGFVTNDFVVVTNIGSTFSYYTNNSTKTIYGPLDFDLMFRWTGTEFRPMFYVVN